MSQAEAMREGMTWVVGEWKIKLIFIGNVGWWHIGQAEMGWCSCVDPSAAQCTGSPLFCQGSGACRK